MILFHTTTSNQHRVPYNLQSFLQVILLLLLQVSMSRANYLPSSLTGDPTCHLATPGQCVLDQDFQPFTLLERVHVSPTSAVLRFALPDSTKSLQLSTCACLLAKISTPQNEEQVIRPYTPISTNALKGCFDLLIKDYGPTFKMSHYLCSQLAVGQAVQFAHKPPNVKIQAPFFPRGTRQDRPPKTLVLLAGGTGITPMLQVLHAVLGQTNQDRKVEHVILIYGNKNSKDILAESLLTAWEQKYQKDTTQNSSDSTTTSFEVIHILSEEPENSTWKGRRGFINEELLSQVLPSNSKAEDLLILVCGPPPMYTALCGPREEADSVTGALGRLGYGPHQVYKC